MSFDPSRHYREVSVIRDGFREAVQLQKTGIGADIHVYLKGQDIGSIEPFRLEVLVSLPGEQHPRTGMQRTAVRPTEQDALNLLLDVHEQERAHADGCHISRHHHREVREGVVTPVLNPRHGGGPKTYLLTQSMGIITGLAPAEQDFIDRQPNGTKVGLVREMFAFDPERLDVDPGPAPEPTAPPAPVNVSDHLVSFVEFLSRETPVQWERATEHSALWWEHPELVGIFQDLLTRWTNNDIVDDTALMYAFSEALDVHFGNGPEPDAGTTTDPSTTD